MIISKYCITILFLFLMNNIYASTIEQVKIALEKISPDVGCLTNGNEINNEREKINTLLYKKDNKVKALLFNRNVIANALTLLPCSDVLGRCSIYSGSLNFVSFDTICKPNNKSQFKRYTTDTGTVFSIRRGQGIKSLPGTECLIDLARKLRPDDVYAECVTGSHIFSTPGSNGFRIVRVEKNGIELKVQHVRINVKSIPIDWLLDYTKRYSINTIETVGKTGFVVDNLLIQNISGSIKCTELETIDEFKNKVKKAHLIFPMEDLRNEQNSNFWNNAYSDVIHNILGGGIEYGPKVQFSLFQQTDLFIKKRGGSRCSRFH